mmetsp:Transcript_27363/g.40398  ORF Transcript_27363/g.40398 Transcript_27363/m.40398 type:complete len:986 (-) Transcript_27363:148-3105(-)
MATKEIQPKEGQGKEPPPSIVTKRLSPNEENVMHSSDSRQARTPKHANLKGSSRDASFSSREHHHQQQQQTRGPLPHGAQQQYNGPGYPPYPPRDYRYEQQRQGGAPYSPGQQQFYRRREQQPMATVSPGANSDFRQYYGREQGQEYQRYNGRYEGRPPSYAPDGRYDYNNNYPPSGYQAQQQPPPPPQQHQPQHQRYPQDPRYYGRPNKSQDNQRGQTPGDGQPFTRTISSSFELSVKSRNDMDRAHVTEPRKEVNEASHPADTSVAHSDDSSWKQLNQVESIDEAELQKRLADKKEERGRDILVNQQTTSNSSSLTNSPNHGHEKLTQSVKLVDKAPPAPTPSKLTGLDSLSSVASGQEPLETKAETSKKMVEVAPPSPGFSAGTLDLMKCHSGSSGLLHGFPNPTHNRSLSSSSLDSSKRAREERGDINTIANEDGVRRAASSDDKEPPAKKSRKYSDVVNGEQLVNKAKGKSPSLGIDCTPPGSPKGKNHPQGQRQQQQRRSDLNTSPGVFDKAPSYTYERPDSSSTITPVGPSQLSWEEIQQQDSFGNVSAGGGGLVQNFSFPEYPMLTQCGSNLGYNENRGRYPPQHNPPQHNPSQHNPPPVAESRNQSFDGGHYQGGFDRPGNMEHGYPPSQQQGRGGHYPPNENFKKQPQQQHQGPFPPQAPSWGTTTSANSRHGPQFRGPPPYPGGGYPSRSGPPPPHSPHSQHPYMMGHRSYSEDASRTSPPNTRVPSGPPRGFQPPPEFAAPHNPHLNRRPPPAVYISISGGPNDPSMIAKNRPGNGIYSWTKDDDVRLTEVMKKYKNPRDWEPVAKEHGRGKSAKECHERWIRYLKPGVRKGQWQDHEDVIVVEAVTSSTEQPFTRWSDLAQRLPGRVGKQIRDRWVNHLNPNINHLPFSREDDLLLWDGHKKLGKRWVEISTKYFNSTRSENHIKNRWYSASFKKFISNEFGPEAYNGGKTSSASKKGKKKGVSVKEEIESV